MASGLLILVTGAAPPAGESCTLIEAQVISMDDKGDMHMLSNFAQILAAGEPRTTKLDLEKVKGGKLEAKVTWPSFSTDPSPTIDLYVSAPGRVENSSVEATAHLEKLLWDSLFGPEPFKSKQGSSVQLEGLGYVFAVAAVAPSACGSSLKD